MYFRLRRRCAEHLRTRARALRGVPAITNFANPMQLICSAIQAGSRLGYQESAELCAQYLAPILDAIKFNYLPFGIDLFSTADTLPKNVAYSEERLRPPPGLQGLHRARHLLARHIVLARQPRTGVDCSPGMQGVDVQPLTANMLTPESLAELIGGPDIVAPPAPPMAGPARTAQRLRREQPTATSLVPAATAVVHTGAECDIAVIRIGATEIAHRGWRMKWPGDGPQA